MAKTVGKMQSELSETPVSKQSASEPARNGWIEIKEKKEKKGSSSKCMILRSRNQKKAAPP